MQKAYVSVICSCDKEGVMQPIRICRDDGRSWDVKESCTPARRPIMNLKEFAIRLK